MSALTKTSRVQRSITLAFEDGHPYYAMVIYYASVSLNVSVELA